MSLDMPVGKRLAFNSGATYLNAAENDGVLGPPKRGMESLDGLHLPAPEDSIRADVIADRCLTSPTTARS